MAAPSLTVPDWPTGEDLRRWHSATPLTDAVDALVDECVADAAASVWERIDTTLLPEDESCPRTVFRAIVLEAARLLYRPGSPHGVAAFGEVALRLRSVDVDVDNLLMPWRGASIA